MLKRLFLACLLSLTPLMTSAGTAQLRNFVAFRGTYNANTTYGPNDAVLFNNILYASTGSANIGNTPGSGNSYWTQLTFSTPGTSFGYQVNGTAGSSSTLLNIVPGTNIAIQDLGSGRVQISDTGSSSSTSAAAATSSSLGTVELPAGQTSTTLAKVAITGAYGDLAGIPVSSGGGAVSTVNVSVESMCSGATQTDLNTGIGGTDIGPCVNSYLSAHVSPTQFVNVILDGPYRSSGIFGPRGGNWGITGGGGGIAETTVTGCNISGNVITCNTSANSLVAGQGLILDGFPNSTFLNEQPVTVLSSGLSATQFQANFTHANANIEAGNAEALYGSGIFQIAGSNGDVIHNNQTCIVDGNGNHWMDAGWVNPGAALPSRGANMFFRKFVINGNRNNNSTTGNPFGWGGFNTLYNTPYCYFSGINIDSINNSEVEGVTFYQIAAYDIKLVNVGDFTVQKNSMLNYGYRGLIQPASEDGVHVSAPANDGLITNNYLRAANDAIAFNAPEGYVGTIQHMVASFNRYAQDATAGRVYTGSIAPPAGDATPTATDILWEGNVGTVGTPGTTEWGFQIGLENVRNLTTNTISGIRYVNNVLSTPSFLYTNDNIQDVTLDGNEWLGGTCSGGFTSACGMVTGVTLNHQIGNLTLTNNRIIRSSAGSAATSFVDEQSGGVNVTLGQVILSNDTVTDSGGPYPTMSAILLANGSTASLVEHSGLGWDKLTSLVPVAQLAQISKIQSSVISGTRPCGAVMTAGVSSVCPGADSLFASTSGEIMNEATTRATDEKLWDVLSPAAHQIAMRFVKDDNTDARNVWTITRNGYIPTAMTFFNMPIQMPGTTTLGTGQVTQLFSGPAVTNYDTAATATLASAGGHTAELQGTNTGNARAAMLLSSNAGGTYTSMFEFGTDSQRSSTKNFYIYNYGSGKFSELINPDDSITYPFTTAPTGSCSYSGSWAFSQDGHGSTCLSGAWSQRF